MNGRALSKQGHAHLPSTPCPVIGWNNSVIADQLEQCCLHHFKPLSMFHHLQIRGCAYPIRFTARTQNRRLEKVHWVRINDCSFRSTYFISQAAQSGAFVLFY